MGITIKNGGFLTTVQDKGRIGYQKFGVPVAGAMDDRALQIANMLVGNQEYEAVLEVTLMGPMIEFTQSTVISLTGGDLTPKINNVDILMYKAVLVNKGDVLSFGANKTGCRTYISFAGGLDIEKIMGSKSTYLKAKIGGHEGRKLEKGDVIKFVSPKKELPNLQCRAVSQENLQTNEIVLRVVMGPQDDYFTPKGIETFLTGIYTVTNEFDRMGCRLEGDAIEHVKGADIISDGIAFGAIQIPSQGKPIIMLADRQTTGGYTKIANVISVDLPKIAQSKPGDKIKFKEVSIKEAQELYLKEIEELKNMRKDLDNVIVSQTVNKTFASHGSTRKYRVVVNNNTYDVEVELI